MAEEKQRTEKRKRSVTWRRGIHLARVSSRCRAYWITTVTLIQQVNSNHRNGVVSRMEEKAIWRALATSLEINQLNLCCFESSFISWFYCIVSPNPPDVIRRSIGTWATAKDYSGLNFVRSR
ncbi:hypothetical protein OIU78_018999 [Salix suchowensis]|nr:hypothetical protein OIU78_018999 [Salix suchowensis]